MTASRSCTGLSLDCTVDADALGEVVARLADLCDGVTRKQALVASRSVNVVANLAAVSGVCVSTVRTECLVVLLVDVRGVRGVHGTEVASTGGDLGHVHLVGGVGARHLVPAMAPEAPKRIRAVGRTVGQTRSRTAGASHAFAQILNIVRVSKGRNRRGGHDSYHSHSKCREENDAPHHSYPLLVVLRRQSICVPCLARVRSHY